MNVRPKLEVRAQYAPWYAAVEVMIRIRQGNATAEPLVMVERSPGMCVEPTFVLETEQAQTLMDDLWACGLRPTEGSGSAGALAATERHLKDMRTLVFKAQGMEVKGIF